MRQKKPNTKVYFLFGLILATMLGTLSVYLFSRPVEERWAERQADWEQKEKFWEYQLTQLQNERKQMELVTSMRFIDHKRFEFRHYEAEDDHAIVTVFDSKLQIGPFPQWIQALILFRSISECETRVKNKIVLTYDPHNTIPPLGQRAFANLGVELRTMDEPPRVPPSQDWRK